VEVTDGTADYNATNYRLSVFYDLAESGMIRIAWAQAQELGPRAPPRSRSRPNGCGRR
jgi:outer membrane receptor protein involved in Fe transport